MAEQDKSSSVRISEELKNRLKIQSIKGGVPLQNLAEKLLEKAVTELERA